MNTPISFPPQGLFVCCSHCLAGSLRSCLGHFLTLSSSLHKCHLLRRLFPDHPVENSHSSSTLPQTHPLYPTWLFIALISDWTCILCMNLQLFSHCNVGFMKAGTFWIFLYMPSSKKKKAWKSRHPVHVCEWNNEFRQPIRLCYIMLPWIDIEGTMDYFLSVYISNPSILSISDHTASWMLKYAFL